MCPVGHSKVWKTRIYLKDFDLFYEEVEDATPPSHSTAPNTWKELGPYAPYVSEFKRANISKIYLEPQNSEFPLELHFKAFGLTWVHFLIYNFIRRLYILSRFAAFIPWMKTHSAGKLQFLLQYTSLCWWSFLFHLGFKELAVPYHWLYMGTKSPLFY